MQLRWTLRGLRKFLNPNSDLNAEYVNSPYPSSRAADVVVRLAGNARKPWGWAGDIHLEPTGPSVGLRAA
jgi:hypothetical protein